MAPKPDHSTHGETRTTPHNTWTKDTKVKTAKCRICSRRVENFSWQCRNCKQRICSVCCEHDYTGTNWKNLHAKDMLENGCWCQYFSGFNPKFNKVKGTVPDKHEDQVKKDAEAKRKAQQTSARKRAGPDAPRPAKGSSRKHQKPKKDALPLPEAETPSKAPRGQKPSARVDGREYEDNVGEDGYCPQDGCRIALLSSVASSRKSGSSTLSASERGKREESATQPESKISEDSEAQQTHEFGSKQGRWIPNPFYPTKGGARRVWIDFLAKGSASASKTGEGEVSKKSKTEAVSPLEGGHTVIVGAGVVGLFTAHTLASKCNHDGIEHKITVFEIRPEVCELASGQCAGFLTARDMPEDGRWMPLLTKAKSEWVYHIGRGMWPEFGLLRHSHTRSGDSWAPRFEAYFAKPDRNAEDDGAEVTFWFKPRDIHHVDEDAEVLGRIDPRMLADWLKKDCKDLGVRFLFEHRPESVAQDVDGYAVTVLPGGPNMEGQREVIKCSHLVFAAGPFTTSIIADLFEDREQLDLPNVHSKYIWTDRPLSRCRQHEIAANEVTKISQASLEDKEESGLAVTDTEQGVTVATPGNSWNTGTMSFAVRAGQTTVEVSSALRDNEDGDISFDEAANPAPVAWQPVYDLSRQYVRTKLTQEEETGIQGGGAYISVAKDDAPYVGSMRIPRLDGSEFLELDRVYLSYGFGRFGTTLAPGAAKMLVDEMNRS